MVNMQHILKLWKAAYIWNTYCIGNRDSFKSVNIGLYWQTINVAKMKGLHRKA